MKLLLISTVSCILESIIPAIIQYVTTQVYSANKDDIMLRNDLLSLKQEMSELSMVDEFSKYAKLQRKYSKLEDILKIKVNERLSFRRKIQLIVTYTFRFLNTISIFVLLYFYNTEPVIILPKDTLWPIQNFLSWPSYQEDSISLVMWFIIARTAISTCSKIDVS